MYRYFLPSIYLEYIYSRLNYERKTHLGDKEHFSLIKTQTGRAEEKKSPWQRLEAIPTETFHIDIFHPSFRGGC